MSEMEKPVEELAKRIGKKKAIVAIGRTLAIRIRRLLLNKMPYQIGVLA